MELVPAVLASIPAFLVALGAILRLALVDIRSTQKRTRTITFELVEIRYSLFERHGEYYEFTSIDPCGDFSSVSA